MQEQEWKSWDSVSPLKDFHFLSLFLPVQYRMAEDHIRVGIKRAIRVKSE